MVSGFQVLGSDPFKFSTSGFKQTTLSVEVVLRSDYFKASGLHVHLPILAVMPFSSRII
jgi:hypothetical protein